MFTEPLAGWRQATARESKTKVDWAIEVAQLVEGRYADCEKVILVSDNLNTHTKGAFYTAFEPARARALVCRLEFCHTPKHGSWLNIAENELSSMTASAWQVVASAIWKRCNETSVPGPQTLTPRSVASIGK